MYWNSDNGTHLDIEFFPKPVHGGYLLDKLALGQPIPSRPVHMRFVLRKLALGGQTTSQTSLCGIFVRQIGTGAADSIQSSSYEVCVEKTDTGMSNSIPDQSMWDLCSTNWQWGSGFHPRPVYVRCVSDKVALRQVLLRVIRFPLVNIIPPTLPLIHPSTRTLYVRNFSNWLRRYNNTLDRILRCHRRERQP